MRDHCAAARTLASKDSSASGSATTSRRPDLHRGAQQARRVLGGEQDQPDLGYADGEVAREVEHRRAAERVVEQDDVDVQPAQRAVDLVEVGDDVDDVELGLARLRGRAARGLVVGDGDQQPRAHRIVPSFCFLRVLAAVDRLAERAVGRVAAAQQREPHVGAEHLRVRDLQRLALVERERDRHDLARVRGRVLDAVGALQTRRADVDHLGAGHDHDRAVGPALGASRAPCSAA